MTHRCGRERTEQTAVLKVIGLTRRTQESAGTGGGQRKIRSDGRIPSSVASLSWICCLRPSRPKDREPTTSQRRSQVYQGRHRVEQLPLKIPNELAELLSHGPDYVLKFLDERVRGLTATESGAEQLRKFCNFIELHKQGTRVEDIASRIQVHRTTVTEWRDGTDQPYLVSVARKWFFRSTDRMEVSASIS